MNTKAKLTEQLETLETDLNATLQTLSTLLANSTPHEIETTVMPLYADYRLMKMCIETSKAKVVSNGQ